MDGMVKIGWKVVNGYGPYGYLQRSVKVGGKVKTEHIAYLGKAGEAGLIPGKGYTVGQAVEGHAGVRVIVPEVPLGTVGSLKPGPVKAVHWMKQQVDAGVPKVDISAKPPKEPTKVVKTKETLQALGEAVSEKKASTELAAAKVVAAKLKEAGLEGKVTPAQVAKKLKAAVEAKAAAGKSKDKYIVFSTKPGPKTTAVGQVTATLQEALAGKPGAPIKAVWTKVGPQQGSTPGGVYQDQLGHKHYIKRPPSQDHVKNEMLARDLYKLAGVKVLDAQETELDGRPAIASKMVNMVKCGTNPKDVPGTIQGFAADAWLANWDSVGVGSGKYDNICTIEGEAYRVDTGGALKYRGAGAPKGAAFGAKVTELERLRDPKVNPVAATVFGDMTLEQIEASAKPIIDLSNEEVRKTVAKHYDGAKGKALADKLITRADYMAKWLEKEAPKDAKVLASEAARGAGLPKGGVPKVDPAYVYKDNKGKPYVTSANIKKLEKAASTGDQNALYAEATAMADKMLSSAKKSTVWAVAAHLKSQMQGVPILAGC